MKKLDKYIIGKYFSTFFLSIALLLIVVVVFDISEKIDDFISAKVSFKAIIFDYYFNFIPYFLNLFLYLFVFISVIFFTSEMAQHSEIIAILSSNVSYVRFLMPYIFSSFVLLIIAFLLSNFIIPRTNIELTKFEKKYIHTSSRYTYGRDIHVQIGPDTYVYVQNFNSKTNVGANFTLEKINLERGMSYKLNADEVVYDENKNIWTLKNYFERKVLDDKEIIREGSLIDTTLNLLPKDLIFLNLDVKTMNYSQLKQFIKQEKEKCVRNIVDFEVEQYARTANSFATIILTLLGVGLSSRKKRSGIGINLGLGITLTFVYILLMQVSKVFATNSGLSPLIAAWIPNFLYIIITLFVIYRAAQ